MTRVLLSLLAALLAGEIALGAYGLGWLGGDRAQNSYQRLLLSFTVLPALGVIGVIVAFWAWKRRVFRVLAGVALVLSFLAIAPTAILLAIAAKEGAAHRSGSPLARTEAERAAIDPAAAGQQAESTAPAPKADVAAAPAAPPEAPPAGPAAARGDPEVAHLKAYRASEIEPELPDTDFESWMEQTVGPDAVITWELNDCGEGGGGSGEVPLCVAVEAKLGECGRIYVGVAVGDSTRGLSGTPALWFGRVDGIGPSTVLSNLHGLPGILRLSREVARALESRPLKQLEHGEAIAFVKRLDVRDLDEEVPSGPLETWIRNLAGAGAEVHWNFEDCQGHGDYEQPPCDDAWACVRATFEDEEHRVSISVRIGTTRKGFFGRPTVEQVHYYRKRGEKHGITNPPLRDLPYALTHE